MSTKNKGYLVPENINPEEEIGFCVPVPDDPAYLKAFWGQMSELGRWGIWEKEPDHKAVEAAARWRDSYQRISSCEPCDCEECEECLGNCGVLFSPEDPHIEYAPNDPFRTPDHVPSGYLLPPWQLDDERPATNLESLPIGIFNPIALLSGLPRFKVKFKGQGTVQLYLRKVPQGGIAYITLDGNPVGAFVDTSSFSIFDIESWLGLLAPIIGGITGSLWALDIVEIEVEGSGDHYIDVTCLPKLGGLFVLEGFGMQLEKVRICTDEQQEELEEMPPQFQVVDCILSWRPNSDADWVELVDLTTCLPETPPVGGIDTPENIDWYCRAAAVFADQLMEQAELEVTRVVASQPPTGLYSYPFEYMIPASERLNQYFVEGQGDWGAVSNDAYEDFGNAMADTDRRELIRTYLRMRFECLFKNEAHSDADYEWEPLEPSETFAGALDFSDSHILVVPPEGYPLDTPNKTKDFADGMWYWFRPYAHAHFEDFINAINYEANLSPSWGVVDCLVEDCDPEPPLGDCEVITFGALDVEADSIGGSYSPTNVLSDEGDPTENRWQPANTTAGHWIKFGNGVALYACNVLVKTAYGENPDAFVIEGSNDEEDWTVLATSNSGAFPRTVTINSSTAYLFHRLRITSTGWVSIQYMEWEMIELE